MENDVKKLNKKYQKHALKKYDKMIAWAEKQPAKDNVDYGLMENEIDIAWFAGDCSYCKFYLFTDEGEREVCPLQGMKTICCTGDNCCGYKWGIMNQSTTWGTWIKKAKSVRKYIEEHGV